MISCQFLKLNKTYLYLYFCFQQWIDMIRTPRASNEARQRLFSKLSGELQRKIGIKVLEMDGNAVIG